MCLFFGRISRNLANVARNLIQLSIDVARLGVLPQVQFCLALRKRTVVLLRNLSPSLPAQLLLLLYPSRSARKEADRSVGLDTTSKQGQHKVGFCSAK